MPSTPSDGDRAMSAMSKESSMTSHVTEIIAKHRSRVRKTLLREKLLAECVGTFFLVLTIGTAVHSSAASFAGVTIGLVLGIQIYTFGAVSGAFFNPAVTFAVLLAGRDMLEVRHATMYIVAQFLGALVAAFCAFGGTHATFCFDYASPTGVGWGTSLELEALFTMALCGTVLTAGTSNDAPNQYFGFAIGLTVTGGAMASGGFHQGSFNPAVTFAINIANYANSSASRKPSVGAWFLFLLAPMLGAALAAAVFRSTRGGEYVAEFIEDIEEGPREREEQPGSCPGAPAAAEAAPTAVWASPCATPPADEAGASAARASPCATPPADEAAASAARSPCATPSAEEAAAPWVHFSPCAAPPAEAGEAALSVPPSPPWTPGVDEAEPSARPSPCAAPPAEADEAAHSVPPSPPWTPPSVDEAEPSARPSPCATPPAGEAAPSASRTPCPAPSAAGGEAAPSMLPAPAAKEAAPWVPPSVSAPPTWRLGAGWG